MLREHPAVLRELGLIAELTLGTGDKGLPPATPTAPGAVRVRWSASTIAPEVVSPWTAYELDSGLFLPASTATISSGLVDLDVKDPAGNPRWQVATVDIDGAVSRLRDAARTYATDRTDGRTPPANDATLPALRSAGLLLMRRDRAEHFAARSDAARANAARDDLSDGPPLTADDLVLGYRMDVRLHGAGDSLSLCRRNATYFLNKNPIGPQQLEEGHVKANAAIRDERTGELRADEVVSRWSGWSLAVPRPALGAPLPPAPNPAPALPFDFSWQFEPVPGSLPELRFNTSYSVRLRVADIAGGGLEHDDPAADRCFSDLTPYARHEPLSAPQIPPPTASWSPGRTGSRSSTRTRWAPEAASTSWSSAVISERPPTWTMPNARSCHRAPPSIWPSSTADSTDRTRRRRAWCSGPCRRTARDCRNRSLPAWPCTSYANSPPGRTTR